MPELRNDLGCTGSGRKEFTLLELNNLVRGVINHAFSGAC